MTCAHIQEMMVEALYRELDRERAREFEQHVGGCASCAALFEEMRATGAAMQERRRPDPGDEYWNHYYDGLEARMRREQTIVDFTSIAARRRSYVSWGYRVAAAVAVLAVGVWLGRSSITRGPAPGGPEVSATRSHSGSTTDSTRIAAGETEAKPGTHDAIGGPPAGGAKSGAGDNVQLASADVRARDYIDRSQVLLLALINSSPDTTRAAQADYQVQRARAGDLVREASVLRDDLPGSDNRRLRELVTDLQMILREIANLESQNDLKAVEIIRNRVSREGVLLKIDVEQMREEDGATKPKPARGGAID